MFQKRAELSFCLVNLLFLRSRCRGRRALLNSQVFTSLTGVASLGQFVRRSLPSPLPLSYFSLAKSSIISFLKELVKNIIALTITSN